ncbi:FAD-dependent oxidoreductase [Streptomyces sp. NBC_01317]|uniref:FAD-dependent oxidoreductase n=1 Tax=Streptomyces sp. NBC_01317 TaxID=2903822 RepID=UPI002E104FF2|nr:FAD-dependent oxidoreductase [Streptomyces sp. NBC_01317]
MLSSTHTRTAHTAQDVVIIGAGIAGLAAAHHLTAAGVSVRVLEAAPHPGGRMSTEHVDGFRLDRVGPLLSTAYPELLHTPALEGIALRMFSPGVLVRRNGRLHRAGTIERTGLAGSAASAGTVERSGATERRRGVELTPRPPRRAHRALTTARALASAPARARQDRTALGPAATRRARPDRPTHAALAASGLPASAVDGFVRPLLTALLGDPGLSTSSHRADLALRAYARGRLCVPAGGASALPELLARTLPPGTVVTDVWVTEASINRVATKEHGEIACRSLLVATGARAAAELLPGLRVPDFHPVTVLHHTAPTAPSADPALVLDAETGGPVAHTAVMSAVDPSRTPDGRVLVSSTVLGTPPPARELDRVVRAQLAGVYGTPTDDWELLAVHHTPEAVPAMPAPHDPHRPVRLLSGLYVCGDHRDTNTVQGALFSGRRAAHAVLRDLGVKPADTEA